MSGRNDSRSVWKFQTISGIKPGYMIIFIYMVFAVLMVFAVDSKAKICI